MGVLQRAFVACCAPLARGRYQPCSRRSTPPFSADLPKTKIRKTRIQHLLRQADVEQRALDFGWPGVTKEQTRQPRMGRHEGVGRGGYFEMKWRRGERRVGADGAAAAALRELLGGLPRPLRP